MIPAWIVAIATAVYAGCTLWLIFEMRKDRKLAYKPIVKVIVIGDYYRRLRFEIKNVGRGPALNPKFDCRDNKEGYWEIEKELLPIGSLEKTEAVFENKKESFEPGENIFLDIEYADIFGKTYKERILTLDSRKVMNDIGVTKK